MKIPHYINGEWVDGEGDEIKKVNPSTGGIITAFDSATRGQTDQAVAAARRAFPHWSNRSVGERQAILTEFAGILNKEKESLAELISVEIGKPRWEAATEVGAMIGKIDISVDAFQKRCSEFTGGPAVTRFRPHGVVGVLGPFNFPGHLPNGHIVPALLAGNTIVYKPSEQAPLTAKRMVELWAEAGLPDGVLNLVQGGIDTGQALIENDGLDGVFFTGSAQVGESLRQHFSTRPGKILALEMGGNNPLVVEEVGNSEAAVFVVIQSAFLTAGQRCSCARRLILPEGEWGDQFVSLLRQKAADLVVGPPDQADQPFMGPVISAQAANRILDQQDELIDSGAEVILQCRHLQDGTGLLTPGILDVTAVNDRADEEIFGPLLQVIRVPDFDSAIVEATQTRFGLAAGLVSDSRQSWQRFQNEVRAGVMNWNQQLTGASSAAPFGGVGRSGNFRPGAFFAADYCSWPTASIEVESLRMPDSLPPGMK
ncbi:MAG: succinylglutamate-semialdehyde dehydrogenase [Verrucomicrobiales bacterium]|nr:succinylglutamate-semialdehyde dehydrogenase [Verrucomicrobiales bacterium]